MPIDLTSVNYETHVNDESNIIIDFSATWCGPCKRMEPYFKAAEQYVTKYITMTFAKVDVDSEPSICEKYNIECMPTIVLIKNNKILEVKMGALSYDQIILMISKHFDLTKKTENTENTGNSNHNPILVSEN